MGVTKKAKITFTCEPDLKNGLEDWAQSESRTLSNLIEMVIRQAYEIHQKLSSPTEATITGIPVTEIATETETPPATKAKRGKANKEAS